MLEELQVQNYTLIENVVLDFKVGLNVLSGETGAGKSILVGALSLLLGAKAGADLIRTGKDESLVTGQLNIADVREAKDWLDKHQIEYKDDLVVLRRKIKKSGRGTMLINSIPVTRGELEEFSALLFDLQGQHEHQSLLKIDNHLGLLDRYADIGNSLEKLKNLFIDLTNLRKEYDRLIKSEKDFYREKDLLVFAVNEIEGANLQEGEEESLLQERKILSQYEKLNEFLDEFIDITTRSGSGGLAGIQTALNSLQGVVEIDKNLTQTFERFENLYYEFEDVIETIKNYRRGIDFSPGKLEQTEDRLALIRRLEKKYGNSIEDVIEYAEKSRLRLETMETFESDKSSMAEKIAALEKQYLESATEISKNRKASAERLKKEIEGILKHLGMEKTVFQVSISRRESKNGKPLCSPNGFDSVEFLITPNPGEPLKPLKSIASGGEISRVMLAIKTVLTDSDNIPCLVYDEIDAGIGGEVAVAVGEYLSELSRDKQILCITHLAPIAVRADNHIRVEKKLADNYTMTDIETIKGQERTVEIARMLAGDKTGDASLSHAEEMLNEIAQRKKS